MSQEDIDVDALIAKLLGESAMPAESLGGNDDLRSFEQQQYYQLPVKHTQGGTIIDEKNKPWVVGHFFPGKYLNETHPNGHNGVDLKAPKGAPVYSIAPGKVTKAIGNWKTVYGIQNCQDYMKKIEQGIKISTAGNMISIIHHNDNVTSLYLHFDEIKVSEGQDVSMSTIIGTVGETGNAMCRGGGHLHYEVKVDGTLVDPQKIIGKPIGSFGKKAEFIKKLIAELDERSIRLKRTRMLKKIAAEMNGNVIFNEIEKKNL